MAVHKGGAIYCPIYVENPSRGNRIGCGGTRLIHIPGNVFGLDWECEACGIRFGSSDIDYDRKVRADAKLRAAQDVRIANGRYT